MENIKERIRKHFNQLTNQQKLVAKFILEEPKQIALHPAKVIGTLTGTSETTVIRLCYALDYSGYSALQNDIRESLLQPNEKVNQLQKYRDSTEQVSDTDKLITSNMEQDIDHIRQSLGSLDHGLFEKAVDSLVKAKRIVVVGFRSSYSPATWLAYTLNIIKGHTHLYRGQIDDANYLMTQMDAKWLVVALSFPRYSQETISFAKAAKEKGAKILALTDDELSPIGPIADLLIKVKAPVPTALKGMATMFSVLNVLISGVVQADRKNVQQRIKQYDETSQQFYSFFDTP